MSNEEMETPDTSVQDGESEDTDTNPASEQDSSSEEKDYSKLYENQKTRAEKAEQELKEFKEKLQRLDSQEKENSKPEKETQQNQLTREEAALIASGLSLEEVDKLHKIAQVEELSLSEAKDSDIFTSWKAAHEKRKKESEAQLGGSKGRGSTPKKKDATTPGLPEEEHKKLWKQSISS